MIIRFHSEAKKEFFKTAEYYEEQVIGLGDEFIDEVERVLKVIEKIPKPAERLPNWKEDI